MDKYTVQGYLAVFASLVIGVVFGAFIYGINPYWPDWAYLAFGASMSLGLTTAYLVYRKPDEVISLELSIMMSAQTAEQILAVSENRAIKDPGVKEKIRKVAFEIAKIGDRCIRRELPLISVQINRLEKMAVNFFVVIQVLTGKIYLAPEEMEAKVAEIKTKFIPETMEAIVQLGVAIDSSEAQRIARAEEDQEVLLMLYENNATAKEAVKMLKNLIRKSLQEDNGEKNENEQA